METCHRCQAFLQPEWDRCKICGAARPTFDPTAPPPPGPVPGDPAPKRSLKDPDFPIVPVVAGVGVVLLLLVVGVLVLTSSGTEEQRVAAPSALPMNNGVLDTSAICDGDLDLDPSAPVYDAQPGYHGIQIWRPSDIGGGVWARESVDDPHWNATPQLVACAHRVSETFAETCPGYEGGRTVDAYDATYEVRVRSVRDGSVVHETTVGSIDHCPMSTWFHGNQSTAIYYRPPKGLEEALAPIVAVPDATGLVPDTTPDVPQPVPDDPACAPPPFVLTTTVEDGTPIDLTLTHAWLVTFEGQPKDFLFLTDFPVDPALLRTRVPPTPPGGHEREGELRAHR